uniref:beta-glucosidase n=1 Tax=termite gut metagenome TaxID=433724 RepID=S0DDA4_9ZZZZ
MKYKFPSDFEWGTASASYQIEGAFGEDGKGECIWDRFCHIPGNISDGSTGDRACDFYHRYREDIAILKSLGIKVYRLSVSWPRIYPDGVGKVNSKGIDFYRNVLSCLRENGIKTAVTVYHWDLPQKLQDRGGWTNRDIVGWFAGYASTLYKELGDLVDYWITLNEPYCASMLGYWFGAHAPGYHDYSAALLAAHHLLMAHGAAVKAYRETGLKAEIGITLNMNMVYPQNPDNPDDARVALLMGQESNDLFGDPVYKGTYPKELFEHLRQRGVVLPDIHDGDMALINQDIDFFGLNTYFPVTVKSDESAWPIPCKQADTGRPRTDMNWEISPEGFYDLLKWIDSHYGQKKIIITENGAACNDWVNSDGKVEDPNRREYLKSYIAAMHRAMSEGVPVKGYYVWCFCDNFEWAHGLTRRFGMIYVDYKTQRRIPKESAYWYSNIIRDNGF